MKNINHKGFFKRNNKLITLYISSMLFATGFMSVIPSLPFLALDLNASPFEVALVISLGPFVGIFASITAGSISDYKGRKYMLALCCLIYSLSYFSFYFIDSLVILLLARIFGGMGAFWNAVCQASISESVDDEDKVTALGLLGACFGIGIVIGMSFSAIMLSFGFATFKTMSFYSSGIILAAMIYNLIFFKETNLNKRVRLVKTQAVKIKTKINFQSFVKRLLPPANILHLLVVVLLFHLTFTGIEGTLALFTKVKFDYDPAKVSQLIAVGGFAGILGNILVSKLNKMFGETNSARIASILCLFSMMTFVFADGFFGLIIAIFLVGMGAGIFLPIQQSLIARQAKRNASLKTSNNQGINVSNQGKSHGMNQSMLHLARVLGPIFAASLFQKFSILAPYYFGILSFITIFILITLLWTEYHKSRIAVSKSS